MLQFSNCIKKSVIKLSLMLFSITFFSTSVNCQEPKPQTEPDLNLIAELQKDALEQLLLQALDQLKLVDATIEDLATVVSNDIVKKIKDKSDHLTKLRLTRSIVSSLTNSSYVVVDPLSIYALIHIGRSVANFLLDSLDKGFYELDYFDISHINIPQVNTLSFEDLQRGIQENNKILAQLDYKAANVGLCWYNKAYRAAKRRIAHPWQKYHLTPISLISTISGAAAFLLLYNHGGKLFPQSLRNLKIGGKYIFGWPLEDDNRGFPRNDPENRSTQDLMYENDLLQKLKDRTLTVDQYNQAISNQPHLVRPVGLLGHIEHSIASIFYTSNLPITATASALTCQIGKALYPSLEQWISQKIKMADNYMMGGAYRHRPVGDIQYLTKVTFDNVIGCTEAKKVGKTLCMYLKDPERFDRAKLTPAKGYLLVGETRTGKSFFVESLLGELQQTLGSGFGGFKIYKISYSDIESKGIEYMLSLAKEVAPCILFIDEIDLLGLQRSQDRKRLSEFLTAMSGYLSEIDPDKAVIIIGATNKQESIDFALTQPGRFGVIIPFERPNFEERKEFIKRELTKLAVNLELFDIDKLARESEGYVFEAIGLVIKKAMINAKINNQPISQKLLEKSFDETIRGILEDTKTIPENQKELIAAHMAGHALVNILLNPHLKLNKVSIQKIRSNIKEQSIWVQAYSKEEDKQKPIEYGKLFLSHDKDALEFETKDDLIKQCKVMLAGHIAERLLLGQSSYSYHSDDRQHALKLVQSMVFGGIQLEQLPKEVKSKYLTDAYNLMTTCEQEVETLLQQNKEQLHKLSQALVEKGTLGVSEINSLLNGQQTQTNKGKEKENTLAEIIEHTTKIDQQKDQKTTGTNR